MTHRVLAAALTAFSLSAPAALAQDVVPLAGKGENIQPIARVNVPRATEVEMAGDWAFIATDKGEDGEGGLVIVNIADPAKPFIQGRWTGEMADLRDASYGDVDLSPDGNLAVLTNAHCSSCAEGKVAWVVLLDVTDKSKPRLIGKIIDDATMDYVHTSNLDNKLLYLNPQVAAFYPQPGNSHITVFDISDPTKPVKKATIASPVAEAGLAHDSYVDHRPDGKSLLYGASIHKTDVFDVTDPMAATWLQSTAAPDITISHDVQPNHDRSIIVVDDEGALGGQLDENVSVCGKVGTGPAALDSGSVHFFAAAPDGTFANAGLLPLGSFNAPTNVATGACVAHVFWQAPDQNRMTQAYYRTGAFIVDFEDPANAKQLGWFLADGGAMYWSHKPHRGYLFASDMDHGLDILRYTGEGGSKWPATAGPAEVQRSARQGVTYVPLTTTSGPVATAPLPKPTAPAAKDRSLGSFAFRTTVKRVPGKKGRRTSLVLSFTDTAGKRVGSVRFTRAAARRTTVKVTGVAVSGRYRYTLRAGRKVLRRGTVRVGRTSGLALSPGARLVARVR